jgi:hypothetical protein
LPLLFLAGACHWIWPYGPGSGPWGHDTPRIAWNGQQFGMVWSDQRSGTREVYITTLDENGQPGVTASRPRIAWDGAGFGVFWVGDCDADTGHCPVYFNRAPCGR